MYQLATVLTIPVLMIPMGITVVKSAFLGGLIALLASLVSSGLVTGKYTAQQADRILVKFYVAQIVKFTIIATGFGLVFWAVQPLNVLVLLAVFFIAQVIPAVFLSFR